MKVRKGEGCFNYQELLDAFRVQIVSLMESIAFRSISYLQRHLQEKVYTNAIRYKNEK